MIQNSVSGTKNTFKEIFCHVTVNSLYFEWMQQQKKIYVRADGVVQKVT